MDGESGLQLILRLVDQHDSDSSHLFEKKGTKRSPRHAHEAKQDVGAGRQPLLARDSFCKTLGLNLATWDQIR